MVKAAILDDELLCVNAIASKLSLHCPDVSVIGKFTDPLEALKEASDWNIDLLFLDVEMPRLDGFGFLESLDKIGFHVIFTTAYNQHAVRAFRYNALDYLLKPVNDSELIEAISKFKEHTPVSQDILKTILKAVNTSPAKPEKIAIPTQQGLEFVSLKDIVRLKAIQNYTELYLNNRNKILSSRNMKYFEDLIDDSNFIRVHHAHIININYASKYHKGEGGIVIMEDGTEIDVAARRKQDFLKVFK